MKYTTNFPYDVKVAQANTIKLEDKSDHDYFRYFVKLPDYIFNENKYIKVKDDIEIVADISCSSTMFRKVDKSNSIDQIEISISKNKVFKSFSIDLIVIFKSQTIWDNSNLNKGMPILHLGSYKIDLDTGTQGLILFKSNDDSDEIDYSFTQDSIQILLPENKYNWLLKNKHNPLAKNILSSQFAQIALIEACHKLKDESNDHLLWFKELKNKWNTYNQDNKDYPEDTEIVPFVNFVLNKPSQNLLNYIKENHDRDE
jgi:hypothetical protein